MNFFVALIVAMLATAILGVVIEFLAYRPLRPLYSCIAVLITAIGVSSHWNMGWSIWLVLIPVPSLKRFKQFAMIWGPVSLTNVQLMILAISLILMILLQVIVQRLRWGKPCVQYP